MRRASRSARRLSIGFGFFVGVAGAVGAQVITEFPTPGETPRDLVAGPGGSLWYTTGNAVGRMSVSGEAVEYPVPTGARDIAAGADGNLWYTTGSSIGRITAFGDSEEFQPAGQSADAIVPGPAGNLWFTELYNDEIGIVSPDGRIVEYEISCMDLAAAPDGNVWCLAWDHVDLVSPSGETIASTAIPSANATHATVGPDGNLWFTQSGANHIGRLNRDGTISEFPVRTGGASPLDIVAGPDGNLWFTEATANRIGRMSTTGVVTGEFPLPSGSSAPQRIALGPDGNLWFTESAGQKIGRITPGLTGPCVADSATLCLGGGAFRVQATWSAPTRVVNGTGRAIPMSGSTGAFWFFDAGGADLVVKVVDGCALNGHYWVFAGGLTNVGVALLVTDTTTEKSRYYSNPGGAAFPSIQDTTGLPCR